MCAGRARRPRQAAVFAPKAPVFAPKAFSVFAPKAPVFAPEGAHRPGLWRATTGTGLARGGPRQANTSHKSSVAARSNNIDAVVAWGGPRQAKEAAAEMHVDEGLDDMYAELEASAPHCTAYIAQCNPRRPDTVMRPGSPDRRPAARHVRRARGERAALLHVHGIV